MNKLQKIILSLYAAVILVMFLIPPYQRNTLRTNGTLTQDMGYRCIWDATLPGTTNSSSNTVNFQLLGIQMLVASLVTAALWLVAKDGNPLAGWSITKGARTRKTKRTALAFIVCFTLFVVCVLAKSLVRAAGFRLGFIPDVIFYFILFAVWRAIRRTGSDSATEQTSNASAPGVQNTSAQTLAKSAAPSTRASKPLPSSASPNSPAPLLGITEPAELSAFELLAKEKKTGFRHEALWLKCFSEAEGDQARAEAAYTRERAATLVAQAAAEKDAALAHSAARLGAWRAVISQHMSKIEGLLAEVPKQKAAASRDVQVGNRAEMETLTKALPQALAEFQTAANKLRSEIQPSEWGAGHLKQPLAAAVKDDTPESLAWFECQALVNQGEAWNQLNMRVQDAMYRLDGWLLLHDAHVKTLRIADAAISDKYVSGKQQAKIITELYEELKGVRFSGLNYKYLEGYVFAREYRSSMILLAVFCLIIAGLIGFGIYSAQTAKPLHGSQTGSNYHTLNVITPAPLAALAENAPIAEIRSRAEQGEKEAQFRLGKTYYDGKDVSKDDVEAVKWYRKAAEQGLATAQNYLGMCYHKGEGVRQDDVEAVKWFRESAGQGHGNAQYNLGVHYYAGEGVVQDKVEAVKWYRKAAEQGLAVAQVDLGLCYQDGLGVFKDEVEAVRWYRKAAEQGLAEAQNELGFCYHEGEGVPQDDVEAVKWFRKAAEQGHAIAQNTLGAHYQRGEGVPQDNVEAVRWYRKAAEQGDATAQDNLGHCYHRGEGVLQDEVEGVRWFRKAAEQGHAEAQNTLAICYDHGLGISQDYAEAVKWYHKAAEQGLAPAQNYLGMCYRDGVLVAKDDLEAVKWFRKAAEQKFAYAQFNLGRCYHNGEGVPPDDVEAASWYRKAAEQGFAEAQNRLGVRYGNGAGVPKDEVEAMKWYRKAAEQGDAKAQNNLGVCYHYGRGVLKDDVEAVKWYRKAAEQGLAVAQSRYGWCYHKGEGVRQDDVEAVSWFRKAAEQGHAEAQYRLGICYSYSVGLPKDIIEAAKWFILAAAQQDELSVKSLSNIEKEMTPEQIAEAHRRADEFK